MMGLAEIFELTPGAAEAALSAAERGAMSVNEVTWWTIILPIIINGAMLAYLLGGLNSKLDSFGKRIEKLEGDSERERESYSRVDDRIHSVALSLAGIAPTISEIRTRVDSLCLEAAECPLAKGQLVPRVKRRAARAEDEA